jgi:hypothetical protein
MDQAPSLTAELMFKDVWCNPFAAAVLSAVLGPKPVIHYANGNTALKATGGNQYIQIASFSIQLILRSLMLSISISWTQVPRTGGPSFGPEVIM